MKKYGSKGNDKTIYKKRLYSADQMVLPWSDTTKLPIRCSYGSSQPGPQLKPWHYADQVAWQWFGFDQAPK